MGLLSRGRIMHVAVILLLSLALGGTADAGENDLPGADSKWFLNVYLGRYAHETLADLLLFRASFRRENGQVVVVGVGRELWRYRDWVGFEAEAQLGRHFADQDHWEFNALGALRWHLFPWDDYVDTSFAVGDGLSFPTKLPKLEEKYDPDADRVLNYLMFELTFARPERPRWQGMLRIHHRSDVFGLFDGGGSTYLCAGVKYRF